MRNESLGLKRALAAQMNLQLKAPQQQSDPAVELVNVIAP
jgi:hypothetical protein